MEAQAMPATAGFKVIQGERALAATAPAGVPSTRHDAVMPIGSRIESAREVASAPAAEPQRLLTSALEAALRVRASDIHLRAGAPPVLRVDGRLLPVAGAAPLTARDTTGIARKMMNDRQWAAFQEHFHVDLSVGLRGVGRVRANVYQQRGSIALALRVITTDVPVLDELNLPEAVGRLVEHERGLVIVTGATGSGKSTTLAALIDRINRAQTRHIITIEDPIEFLFSDASSIVTQREVGTDVATFADGMRAALREDPDVILLGEMRDRETIEAALNAAETGHLVLATLHAPTAAEAITRIVSTFPPEAQPTVRAKLSQNLRTIVAQRLLPRACGESRVPACEIMTVSARVRELILDPLQSREIADLIRRGECVDGMMSFDEHLYALQRRGEITAEIALQHASSSTDLKLKLDGFAG